MCPTIYILKNILLKMTKKQEKSIIRCKFCNRPLGSAIQGCLCGKLITWRNPSYKRNTWKKHKLKK